MFINNYIPSSLIGTIKVILNSFEAKILESLKKEEKIIDNLYSKLEMNLKIGNEVDLVKLKLDLINIKNIISEIISKGKEKIQNELILKDSGYFISNYDINSNNESYIQSIEEGKSIANKLDCDNLIDKYYINNKDNFKNNFINSLTKIENFKEEQFHLVDDALNENVFNQYVKNSFVLGSLRENDEYLNNINKINLDFLNKNENDLDDLFFKLTLLFNEESNKKLSCDNLNTKTRIMNDNVFFLKYYNQFNHDEPRYPNILIRYDSRHYVI